MKKQLLLCACVAIKSLLASDFEDNQHPGTSAQTVTSERPRVKVLSQLPSLVKSVFSLRFLEVYRELNANPSLECIMAAETLCHGMRDRHDRAYIIQALANVPAESYEACVNEVQQANTNNAQDIVNIINKFKAQ